MKGTYIISAEPPRRPWDPPKPLSFWRPPFGSSGVPFSFCVPIDEATKVRHRTMVIGESRFSEFMVGCIDVERT